ncbi:MAG: PadR family transcriptional regulator [Parcubacteria group bacterium Gr01-1014_66]|nr:MAG: PadR family transcriptional regulator [Parcubacteria group bacterium Gr01-1014_66]
MMYLFIRSYLTLFVLRLLKERPMYGYEILQAVEELSQGRHVLKYDALYPLLRELEKNEIIGGEWEASTEGPPRKRFFLLPKGEKVFD